MKLFECSQSNWIWYIIVSGAIIIVAKLSWDKYYRSVENKKKVKGRFKRCVVLNTVTLYSVLLVFLRLKSINGR